MYEISWVVRVKNELFQIIKVETNTLHAINRRKTSWIGHICLLKLITEGKIEGTRRRGRRYRSHGRTVRKPEGNGN
jgi:hypothetical protein